MEESGRQATGSALKQHTHTLNPHTHVLVVANLKIIIKNVKKNERETREFDWGPLVRPVSRPALPLPRPHSPSPSQGTLNRQSLGQFSLVFYCCCVN